MSVEIDLAWIAQMHTRGDLRGLISAYRDHEKFAEAFYQKKLHASEQNHRKVARYAEKAIVELVDEMRADGRLHKQGRSKNIDPEKSISTYIAVSVYHQMAKVRKVTEEQWLAGMAECARIKNFRRAPLYDFLGIESLTVDVVARKKREKLRIQAGGAPQLSKAEYLKILSGSTSTLAGVKMGLERLLQPTELVSFTSQEINGYEAALADAARTLYQVRKAIKEITTDECD